MTPRPYILAEATLPEVQQAQYDVAVLPWGATEAHNYHLPYATDNYESEAVASEAARLAWSAGAKVVVLPTIPFGVNTGQLEVPLCLNMNPSTQMAVISDLLVSLEMHGIRKLVLLNGHGGNDFKQIIRELQPTTGVLLCQLNWYNCVPPAAYFAEPGDHAGELETSVMLHIVPHLVKPLDAAGSGAARTFQVQGLREGWAWTQRHWISVTDDTGVGNPQAASVDKGKAFFAAVTERVAGFLKELSEIPLDDLYVHK